MLHFHVDTHDVGYMPDTDNISTFLAVDAALDDVIVRAEDWLDSVAQQEPDAAIRGQMYASEPYTYADEERDVDKQIEEIQENLRTNEEFTAEVAQAGYLIILEDGVAVIELSPCAEEVCQEYRDEWID